MMHVRSVFRIYLNMKCGLLCCFDKSIVWCTGPEGSSHMCIGDLEAIDITGVDPTKPDKC